MNNKLKRLAAFLFSVILLVFPSCSTPHKENITETEDAVISGTTDENFYTSKIENLPNKDFEGKKFRIATDSSHLIFSGNTDSLVGKEYYLRNAAVEDKYNIKLTLTDESGLPTIGDRIKTEALAGTDYCDLVLLQNNQFQVLAASDSLLNIRSVPYLNTDESYYFQNSLQSTTLGNYSYGISGDFVYEPEDCYALFFNKKLLSQTQLPDIYQLVRDNQWDIENFLIYSEEVFSVMRAQGAKMSGIASPETKEGLINIFWAATGFPFLSNDYGYRPELVFNHEYTQKFIEAVKNTFFRSTSYSQDSEGALESFRNSESFFYIAPISAAADVTGFGVDWGIVPIPKFDINQTAYYSYLDQGHVYAGFAKGTKDLTISGIVTSALFAASENLNQRLKVQSYLNLYLNSEIDSEMMEMIIRTPYYDPVQFFEQMSSSFTASTQTLLYRVISSEGDFTALYDQYSIMFNGFLNSKL